MSTPVVGIEAGTRFGRLVVVGRSGNIGTSAAWLCTCDCGNKKRVRGGSLRRGEIVSCGCRKAEALDRRTHGMRRSPEWKSWDSAIQRTTNPNHKSYADYGGRGIVVCARWASFETFYEDMGPRPSREHSLDRYPDQNGNYEPGNCRWATSSEQANNKRNNVMATVDGRTMTVHQWASASGIPASVITQRVKRGIIGAALLKPVRPIRRYSAIPGVES